MNITEHWRPTTTLRTGLVWLLSADIVTTVAFGFALNHQQLLVRNYRDPHSLPKWSLIGWWWGCTIAARFLAVTIIGQGSSSCRACSPS